MKRTVAMVTAGIATALFAAAVAWGPDTFGTPSPKQEIVDPTNESSGDVRPPQIVAPEGSPNIVLVFGCTVRKDQLAIYGGPDTMPWLSKLAAQGTTFDDALSVSSWTRASAVGVLTSRHPLSFNLPEPGPKQSQRVLPDEAVLLAEVLQAKGWTTLGATANPNLNEQYGMAQGMDDYTDSSNRAFRKGRASGVSSIAHALQTLDQRREKAKPFYLQLMLIDAHHPRRPPEEIVQTYQQPGVSKELATYRASLEQLDEALEQLDRGLSSRNYTAENTLFIFIADHGEGLNEPAFHGPGHGKKMYPTTVSIPWVLRGPGVAKAHRVQGLASGVDVLPTILGLIGLTPPKQAVGADVSAWVKGERDAPLERERAFAYSMFHRADVGSVWTNDQQCQGYFEHDLDHEVSGCFDRHADPTFGNPIELPSLRHELETWRRERIAEGQGQDPTQTEVPVDVADQLKVLGYVDD